MIFFIFILTYSIFIFKPDLALNTSNKLGLTDYKINFEEIKAKIVMNGQNATAMKVLKI